MKALGLAGGRAKGKTISLSLSQGGSAWKRGKRKKERERERLNGDNFLRKLALVKALGEGVPSGRALGLGNTIQLLH